MSLLFDQNLSRRLIGLLATEYPGSEHVERAGLLGADDLTVGRRYASSVPGRRRAGNVNITKMRPDEEPAMAQDEDLLPDYAGLLRNGVRGKHAGRLGRRANLALLAPGVAEAFPTDEAVNDALRSLIAIRVKAPSTKSPD